MRTAASADSPRKPGTASQTLDRGLQILEAFSEERPFLTVGELARVLGLNKTVVFRLVKTLAARGYLVRQQGGNAYGLGLRLAVLGSLVQMHDHLAQAAYPEMKALAAVTRESIYLAVLREGRSECVAAVDSSQVLKASYRVGFRGPLHAGATGKVLLAYAPRAVLEGVLSAGLPAYTPRTITDPAVLWEDLQRIRRQGYAVSAGELDPGVFAVAVPVLSDVGAAIASLSISGPEERLGSRAPEYVRMAQEAAARIAARLGLVQPTYAGS